MRKAVIPFSGGIDSTVMLYDAAKRNIYDEIYAVSFFYNQRHGRKELEAASQSFENLQSKYPTLSITHRMLDMSFLSEVASSSSLTNSNIDVAQTKDVLGDPQPVNYVPFRNLIMLSILCSFAEAHNASDVYYGSALVDSQAGYWDSSKEFYLYLSQLTNLNRKNKISIITPLITLDKKDIIKLGIDSEVPFDKTWTCYEGKDLACGYCPACSSRIKGFMDNKVADPIPYSRVIKFF